MIWLLIDDRAGNRSQCLGVAEALGVSYELREIGNGALGALPNAILGASFGGLTRESRALLSPPWPDAVIAAGRRTAPAARMIKQQSGGRCRIFQIMHPGSGAADFDLIAVPNHDRPPDASNILKTTGAPHGMTPDKLTEASEHWRQQFDDLPGPRIALIAGGSTKRRQFTESMARDLAALASGMADAAGGSLLVSTSRRTDDAVAKALVDGITVPARVYRWGDAGENPYSGYLACADAVIVTGESMSMCSEACAVPVPVYIHAPDALITDKHRRLHEELFEAGYARPFDGHLEDWSHPRLNAATEIAQAIAAIMEA
jgi:mitochondrial fission protein ELM1